MRAFAFTSYGRDAKGTICDIPDPRIDSDEVLVEMYAALRQFMGFIWHVDEFSIRGQLLLEWFP